MKKILFIMSRDYNNEPGSGRKQIIDNYLKYYNNHHIINVVNLTSIFDSVGFDRLRCLLAFFLNIILYPRYPLQSLIYINKINSKRIIERYRLFKPDVIFIDGIRITSLISLLGIKCRQVLDIDDLLSRRYAYYVKKSANLSFGIYGRRLEFIMTMIPLNLKRYIMRKESERISELERNTINTFRNIVFSSSEEMERFKFKYNISDRPKLFSQIFPVLPKKSDITFSIEPQLNFLFIGSDMVLQNHFTLDFLVNIWNKYKISNKLYVIGKMVGNYKYNDNIIFLGYVDDLDEYYYKMDALLSPSFIEGGIKTKVLEAAKYNLPAVGNKITFEGFKLLDNYPFVIEQDNYPQFLSLSRQEFDNQKIDALDSVKELLKVHNIKNHALLLEELII